MNCSFFDSVNVHAQGLFFTTGLEQEIPQPHKNMLCHEYRQFTIVHKKGDVKTGDLL